MGSGLRNNAAGQGEHVRPALCEDPVSGSWPARITGPRRAVGGRGKMSKTLHWFESSHSSSGSGDGVAFFTGQR